MDFDSLVLIPCGDKAIWTARIAGEGWCNELTLIKIPLTKIWSNPERRPEPFEGRISVVESKPSTVDDTVNAKLDPSQPASSISLTLTSENIESDRTEIDSDDTTILPLMVDSGNDECYEIQHNTNRDEQSHNAGKSAKEPIDPIDGFFAWLQNGIRQGTIKTNQPKARVHVVKEGVALMTPGIFQDYALSQDNDTSNWSAIQKKVLKKNWHVRGEKGLNVVKYQVSGASKSTTVNAILFEDLSIVFGAGLVPASNPHFQKVP